jgi:hypothetical protein
MIKNIVSIVLLITVLGCFGGSARTLPQQRIPKDTVISLRRTICYGRCPDYRVTITADGTVTFEGYKYVKASGTIQGKITVEQVQQLISEVQKANFFALKNSYVRKEDGCPEVWTDNPSAITEIKINGKKKSITHYHGCEENHGTSIYPKALTELEDKIDEVAGTTQWIR